MFANDEIRKLAALRFNQPWMEDLAVGIAGDHCLDDAPCLYLQGLLFGLIIANDLADDLADDDLPRAAVGDALFAAAVGSARACHRAYLDEFLLANEGHSC